jgi:hypothetical protein
MDEPGGSDELGVSMIETADGSFNALNGIARPEYRDKNSGFT